MTNCFSKHTNGVSFAPKFESDEERDHAFMSERCRESFIQRGYIWSNKAGNWIDKWGQPLRYSKCIKVDTETGERTTRGDCFN
tara:strand:+ start:80 stop:328 length:249 start_codon:yes stop_codon:yes gene_type:complete